MFGLRAISKPIGRFATFRFASQITPRLTSTSKILRVYAPKAIATLINQERSYSRFRPGDWNCPKCKTHNFASRINCYRCGEQAEGNREVSSGDWICPSCSFYNFGYRESCNSCDGPAPEGHVPVVREIKYAAKPGDWECPSCGFENFRFRAACKKCETPNPNPVEKPGHSNVEGGWICSSCSFNNLKSKTACQKCDTPAPMHIQAMDNEQF